MNPRARWGAHEKLAPLQSIEGVRLAYLKVDRDLLHEVEQALISWFEPPLNVFVPHTPSGPNGGRLKNKIKQFLDSKGITPYQLKKDANIAQRTAYDLYNRAEQLPSSAVLSKICDAYEIQPNEILEWVPKDASSAA